METSIHSSYYSKVAQISVRRRLVFPGFLTSISFAVLVLCSPAEERMKVVLDVESVGLGVSYSSAFLDHSMLG